MRRVLRGVIDWLGGHELIVLVGLLVIVAGTWAFIELASLVLEGRTKSFDDRIILALRRPHDPATPIGPGWLAESGRDVTALGSVTVIGLVAAAVIGFLWLDRKYAALVFVLLATTSGCAISVALKALFRRPRPDVVPHLMRTYSSSFPSGHSIISAVAYLTLGALLTRLFTDRRFKFFFMTVAVVLTGLVGVSRVYMGVHYPTDVLAGWSVGLVWSALCWLVGRWLQRRGQIERGT